MRGQGAFDFDGVPYFRVPDVVDCDFVVLAPKERYRIEGHSTAEHVERGHLTLTFRDETSPEASAAW
jgi:hypothetical protein